MNLSATYNSTVDDMKTVANYLSDTLFMELACVLRSTLLYSSKYSFRIFVKTKIIISIDRCSNSNWDELPLTYNQHQGGGKLTFDIFREPGYWLRVN